MNWWDRPKVWEAALFLAALLLFASTLSHGWVYDDQVEIVLNPLVHSLDHLKTILTTTVWAGAGMETYLYRPLALITYALNHQVSGLSPWSYHLVNLGLHALASVLVFRLGLAWRMPVPAAGLGALLFAVHPVHVEVVAAVFGRKDLLAAVFVLAMVLFHRRALSGPAWRGALPVAAFALALLSKEVGATGVLLVAATDWFLAERKEDILASRRAAGLFVAYISTLLAYVLVRNSVTGGLSIPETYYMDNPLVAVSTLSRLGTGVVVLAQGVLLHLLPWRLSPDYSYNAVPVVDSILDWRFLLAMAGFIAGAISLVRVRASAGAGARLAVLAVSWYLLASLPTSNLLIPVGSIFGERFLYLPSVGAFLLLGFALERAIRRRNTPALTLAVLAVGALTVQTARYSRAWRSDLALFQWAVASVPGSTKAHHKLAEEYLRAGEEGMALRELRTALKIAPDNEFASQTLAMARQRLARKYLGPESGSSPDPALVSDPYVLHLLGQDLRREGKLDEAERYWEAAVAADPSHAESLGDLGVLRLMRSDTTSAIGLLERAVAQDPSMASAWYALARVRLALGDVQAGSSALEHFVETAGTLYPAEVEWARRVLSSQGKN